jgi:hypothetical protein
VVWSGFWAENIVYLLGRRKSQKGRALGWDGKRTRRSQTDKLQPGALTMHLDMSNPSSSRQVNSRLSLIALLYVPLRSSKQKTTYFQENIAETGSTRSDNPSTHQKIFCQVTKKYCVSQ